MRLINLLSKNHNFCSIPGKKVVLFNFKKNNNRISSMYLVRSFSHSWQDIVFWHLSMNFVKK